MSVFIALVVLVIFSFIVYRRWLHPLSQFPGPFLASVSGLYQTYWSFQPNFQENFVRLHEKYGPIVRYSPNGIIFNDPELLTVAYGRRADKSDFFAPNFDTHSTFTKKCYEDHVASKKAIATAYSRANLQLFESRIDMILYRWLGLLEKTTPENGSIDFFQYASYLTADLTSQVVSGRPIGFVEADADVRDLLHHKGLSFRWINFLAIQDNFSWYVRNTRLGRYLFMASSTDKSGIGVFMRERDRIVDLTVDENGSIKKAALVEGSLLKSFLMTQQETPDEITLQDVKAETLFALLAGSSVPPSNLWCMVFLVARDAKIKDALHQELVCAEKAREIHPRSLIVSDEQVRKLPFLDACVQEAFRYAPTISQLPRLSPRDTGLEIYGRHVPPGYSVSTSPWIIGRCKDLYGDDANIFRPERWLEVPPSEVRRWHRNSFHFGYGARKCVAKAFAQLQIYKAMAEIFRRFDVQIDGPTHGTSAGKASTKMFRFIPYPVDE